MVAGTPYRKRRFFSALLVALSIAAFGIVQQVVQTQQAQKAHEDLASSYKTVQSSSPAGQVLETLPIKGRAPKTGYTRAQFGDGWRKTGSCDTRELILARDLTSTDVRDCKVYGGSLSDPYTDKVIAFARGPSTSAAIQIDHVVALSDAWQKGAQALSFQQREALANDPLELLAVDGPANQQKGDGDAATWLPKNKDYRCRYVARQIAVKQKYSLWVTQAEHDAMARILVTCPSQVLPIISP